MRKRALPSLRGSCAKKADDPPGTLHLFTSFAFSAVNHPDDMKTAIDVLVVCDLCG